MRRNLKRKQPDDDDVKAETNANATTPKKQRTSGGLETAAAEIDDPRTPTPRAAVANGIPKTPTRPKSSRTAAVNSAAKRADRSAKRKSATTLRQYVEGEEGGGEDAELGTSLAQEILEEEQEGEEEHSTGEGEEEEEEEVEGSQEGRAESLLLLDNGNLSPVGVTDMETPSKRRRGRPKGSKNRRSPTPEGDLAPEERYFFQNRSGPPEVSNNTLASLKLLTHDEYFSLIRNYSDTHEPEKAYLARLHARAFPQWRFEWHEGFNICLYGWGSKRQLVGKFAEWLYPRSTPAPKIVVVNGYVPKLNIRTVLSMLIAAATGEEAASASNSRLGSQPAEMLDLLFSRLNDHHTPKHPPLILLINSIDAASLRRHSVQALLACLAANPAINLLATADTPTFPLLWDSDLGDRFAFVYHDCTTYAPYTAELDLHVVDDVHELLGRRGRRVGGAEGVGFVLKSLTENSRRLYRLLLEEILNALADDDDDGDDGDDDGVFDHDHVDANVDIDADADRGLRVGKTATAAAAEKGSAGEASEIGIEYKTLYQRASENFVCSSEMNCRTLLKEFYDHQMIVSRKEVGGGGDGGGGGRGGGARGGGNNVEVLGIPLGRDEMERLLEQLV